MRQTFDDRLLRLDEAERWTYGYDNSRQHSLPDLVVMPETEQQVAALLRLCNEYRIAVVARGSGTGTAGAAVPLHHGVVLSTEKLNRIIAVDPDNRTMRVQPGVTNQQVQQAAAQHGFFWPPDPTSAAICTIGGNLACNAAGPRAVKYGTPRENTLGLRAVSMAGECFTTGTCTTKGVVGYDLTRLLIGSEGTLAVVTEATLKLSPLAEAKRTLRALYRDMESAARAVSRIMAQPVIPCALEFMDGKALAMIRDYAENDLPADAGALLMIEVDGPASCIEQASRSVQGVAEGEGCLEVLLADTPQKVDALWTLRKALSPALRTVAPKKINEDVVVPVSRIPALIAGIDGLAQRFGVTIVNFGHAGNGNIHVNLLVNPDDAQEMANAGPCLDALFQLVLELDGTLSGEHGIGMVKREFVSRELDSVALRLMQQIKQQFDPYGLLNPGKALPDFR
ncbi:MAG: FAD-binding protein [Gammaproteobacteria bacterium]|nr:FAD-binding protein [Gammaproteobacteria bacterium]